MFVAVMYFWVDVVKLLHDDRHNVREAKHCGAGNAINYLNFRYCLIT